MHRAALNHPPTPRLVWESVLSTHPIRTGLAFRQPLSCPRVVSQPFPRPIALTTSPRVGAPAPVASFVSSSIPWRICSLVSPSLCCTWLFRGTWRYAVACAAWYVCVWRASQLLVLCPGVLGFAERCVCAAWCVCEVQVPLAPPPRWCQPRCPRACLWPCEPTPHCWPPPPRLPRPPLWCVPVGVACVTMMGCPLALAVWTQGS